MSEPTLTDNLFRRFLAVYGNRFTRMWDGLNIKDIKAQWEAALAKFEPREIAYALDHLPESNPPTLLEFRALCNRAPEPEVKALPGPAPSRGAAAAVLATAVKAAHAMQDGPRAWAYKLRAREQAGAQLTKFQRDAWRTALFRDAHNEPELEA